MEPRPSRFFAELRRCGALAAAAPRDRCAVRYPAAGRASSRDRRRRARAAGSRFLPRRRAIRCRCAMPCSRTIWARRRPRRPNGRDTSRTKPGACAWWKRCRSGCACPSTRASSRGSWRAITRVVQRALELRPATLLDLLLATDALRRPERLDGLIRACAADALSRPGRGGAPFEPAQHLLAALAVVRSVDAGRIASEVSAAQPDAALLPRAHSCGEAQGVAQLAA